MVSPVSANPSLLVRKNSQSSYSCAMRRRLWHSIRPCLGEKTKDEVWATGNNIFPFRKEELFSIEVFGLSPPHSASFNEAVVSVHQYCDPIKHVSQISGRAWRSGYEERHGTHGSNVLA